MESREVIKYMKVLITGSNGFIGKNLKEVLNLRADKRLEIYEYNRSNSFYDLKKFCAGVDIIYHLAAVQRPKMPYGYDDNILLTQNILQLLKQSGNNCPIMFSSSVQAILNNPYAISKRKEENLIIEYGLENRVNTYIFRLPNLFGKFCKPNYTSVIATFCYNTINNLPLLVNDPARIIKFAEVQTTLVQILDIVENNNESMANRILLIKGCYEVGIGELTYYMESLRNDKLPKIDRKDNFYDKLHDTYMFLKEVKFNESCIS